MPADFTQGKWEINAHAPEGFNADGKGHIITSNGEYIATVKKESDAQLISAAPEMFFLLCMLCHEEIIPQTVGSSDYPALEKMQSILEQVTGEKINMMEAQL